MHTRSQRIAALCGVILLAALYIITLIAAIFNFDGTGALFRTCLIATVAVPILIWVYIQIYGIISKKHTSASQEPIEAEEKDSMDKEI